MFLDLNPRPQNPTEIGAAALTHSIMMSQNYQEVDQRGVAHSKYNNRGSKNHPPFSWVCWI